MSADEVLSFHERLTAPMRSLIGAERYGIFASTWVIPAIVGVIAVGFFFVPFLTRLPRPTRRRFVLAGALFVGGAVGVELLEARYGEQHSWDDFIFSLHVAVQEGLEMVGVLTFINALLRHMALTYPAVVLDFHALRPAAVAAPIHEEPAQSSGSR